MGYSLSEAEFQRCLQQFKFINPKVGKFWQGTDVEPGIYIVIAGKVRLLDNAGELIATLEKESSFGEFTLFPEAEFKPYAARASINLQLCFVPAEVLWPLIANHPDIREHLWQAALSRNSLQVEPGNSPVIAMSTTGYAYASTLIHKTNNLSTATPEPSQKKISKFVNGYPRAITKKD